MYQQHESEYGDIGTNIVKNIIKLTAKCNVININIINRSRNLSEKCLI